MLLGQGRLKQGLRRCRSKLTSNQLVLAVPYLMLQRVLKRRVGGRTKGRGRVLPYYVQYFGYVASNSSTYNKKMARLMKQIEETCIEATLCASWSTPLSFFISPHMSYPLRQPYPRHAASFFFSLFFPSRAEPCDVACSSVALMRMS